MALPIPVNKISWGAVATTSTSAAQTQAAAVRQYALVVGLAAHATADPATITMSNSGTALTFTQIADHIYSTGANPRLRTTVWIADISAGLSAQTFTVASTGASSVSANISIWQDINTTSFANVGYNDNAAGDPSITLSALANSENAIFYGAYGVGSSAFTPPSGYTELVDLAATASRQATTGYDVSSPGTTLTLASTNTYTTAVAIEIASNLYTPISTASQTRLGDMTSNGGLAAAFDANTSQAVVDCAMKNVAISGDCYVGTRLASAKSIGRVTVHGSNAQGFVGVVNPNVTLDIYGKSGSDPANATDGTLLGTLVFLETADESAGRTIYTTATSTYDRVWVRLRHDNTTAARNCSIAELVLYEPAGAGGPASGNLIASEEAIPDALIISDDLVITSIGQTRFGDMTLTAGLEVVFDGYGSPTINESASKNVVAGGNGYVGTRLPRAYQIGKVIAYGTASTGFVGLANPSTTLAAYGKSGSDPANSTDGTQLGTLTFTDTGDEGGGRIINVTNLSTWDRVWVRLQQDDSTGRAVFIGELQFFEAPINGTIAATESGDDTAAFIGRVDGTLTLNTTESGSDSAVSTGWVGIAQEGALLQFNNDFSNTGTVSSTIDVPAGTELVVVGWTGYSTTANFFTGGSMTFTKGGVDTAMVPVTGGDGNTGFVQGAMFYMVNPDTGSNKSLKWDWVGTSNANEYDSVCSVTFWSGVNTASAIRSSAGVQTAGIPITTASFDSDAGDRIIAYAAGYLSNTGIEGSVDTWTNLSTLGNVTHRVGVDGAWGTGSPSGDVAVGVATSTNWVVGAVVAIAVRPVGAVIDIHGSIAAPEAGSDTASTLIPLSVASQTRFGDMTSNGGLASAFNGVTDVTSASSACKIITLITNAYVGTRIASAKRIGQAVIYGNNQYGVVSQDPLQSNVTVSIYGKLGSDPANSTDGDLLGSLTFLDTSNENAGRTIVCSTSANTYDRVWARLSQDRNDSVIASVGELLLWEQVTDFSGLVTITGNFSVSETGADTLAGTGSVKVAGNFIVSEVGADTLTISGAVPVAGNFATTEAGADTLAISGAVPVAGNFVTSETGADTAAFDGVLGPVPLFGNLAVSETGADTAALNGAVKITGTFDVSETGADTATLSGAVPVAGNFVTTETGADTAAFTGNAGAAPLFGDLATTEAGEDTLAVTGTVPVTLNFPGQEAGSDTGALTGVIPIAGSFNTVEAGDDIAFISGSPGTLPEVILTFVTEEFGSDTISSTGTVAIAGSFAASETGDDIAAFISGAQITGDFATTEITGDSTYNVSINLAGQTRFGDMNASAALATVFNGITDVDSAGCAAKLIGSAGSAYVGTRLPSPKIIGLAIIHGSNIAGFTSGATQPGVTLSIYGKLGSDPVSSTDGTLLGSINFQDTLNESSGRAVTCTSPGTYDRVWLNTTTNSATVVLAFTSELRLWEIIPTWIGNVTVTGSLGATETGVDTTNLIGAVGVTGNFSTSETGDDTAQIVGTRASQGSIDGQELDPDTASITGAITATGTIAAQEPGGSTAAFTGAVTVTGNLIPIEPGPDPSSIIGAIAVAGNFSAPETGADTANSAGTLGPIPLFGNLAAAEAGVDTAIFLGGTIATANFPGQEAGSSTPAFTGNVTVTGNFVPIETGADTAALTGALGLTMVFADLNPIETGSDPPVISGTVTITGDLPAQEIGSDTASIIGALPAGTALMDAFEVGEDTAALTGKVPALAIFAAQEIGADTTSLVGKVASAANLVAPETTVDTASVAGTVAVAGNFVPQEVGSDTLSIISGTITEANLAAAESGLDLPAFGGKVRVTGNFNSTDDADTAFIDVGVEGVGSVAASEIGSDPAALIVEAIATANLIGTEAGSDTSSIHPDVRVTINLNGLEVGSDTGSFNGTSTVTINLATIEIGQDSPIFSGGGEAPIGATLVVSEAGVDTASGSGTVTVTGRIPASENFDDAAVFNGKVALQGNFAAAEVGTDAAAFIAFLPSAMADLAAQEAGKDTAAFTGFLPNVLGSINGLEVGSDTASINIVHQQVVQVDIAALEAGADTAAMTGTRGLTMVFGNLGTTESGQDVASIPGVEIYIGGDILATEVGSDTSEQIAHAKVTGIFSLKEAGSDIANFFGGNPVDGYFDALEIGSDISFIDMIQQPAILVSINAHEIGSDIARFRGTKVSAKPDTTLMATFAVELMLQGSVVKVHDLEGAL